MKPETRLALLEAFAKAKGYEFNGFAQQWTAKNPEIEEQTVVEPIITEEKLEISANTVIESGEGITITGNNLKVEGNTIEEKPKRKRKAVVEDAGS